MFSAALFQYMAICVYQKSQCTIFIYVVFCWTSLGKQIIICKWWWVMWYEKWTSVWKGDMFVFGRKTHCLECSTKGSRKILVYSEHRASFFHVGYSSINNISIKANDCPAINGTLFGIPFIDEHTWTAGDMVLYSHRPNVTHIFFTSLMNSPPRGTCSSPH